MCTDPNFGAGELNPSRFDYGGAVHERDASPFETAGAQHRIPFLDRPFTAACRNEHIEVRELAVGTFVEGLQQPLDDEEHSIGSHGRVADIEDAFDVHVVPVVQHRLQ